MGPPQRGHQFPGNSVKHIALSFWHLRKMAPILHTALTNPSYCMNIVGFWFRFRKNVFPTVQLQKKPSWAETLNGTICKKLITTRPYGSKCSICLHIKCHTLFCRNYVAPVPWIFDKLFQWDMRKISDLLQKESITICSSHFQIFGNDILNLNFLRLYGFCWYGYNPE